MMTFVYQIEKKTSWEICKNKGMKKKKIEFLRLFLQWFQKNWVNPLI